MISYNIYESYLLIILNLFTAELFVNENVILLPAVFGVYVNISEIVPVVDICICIFCVLNGPYIFKLPYT